MSTIRTGLAALTIAAAVLGNPANAQAATPRRAAVTSYTTTPTTQPAPRRSHRPTTQPAPQRGDYFFCLPEYMYDPHCQPAPRR